MEHRLPIDDDIEDALQRMLESSQEVARRIWRMSRRDFITEVSVGQLGYAVEALEADLAQLKERLSQPKEGNE